MALTQKFQVLSETAMANGTATPEECPLKGAVFCEEENYWEIKLSLEDLLKLSTEVPLMVFNPDRKRDFPILQVMDQTCDPRMGVMYYCIKADVK